MSVHVGNMSVDMSVHVGKMSVHVGKMSVHVGKMSVHVGSCRFINQIVLILLDYTARIRF
jgi:hypothetical protein